MTKPDSSSPDSVTPVVLVLHKGTLSPAEVTRERGYALTRPLRAILDCAAEGDADRDLLRQALEQGLRRGLITRSELKRATSMDGLPAWLTKMLER